MPDKALFDRRSAADYLDVSPGWLRRQADIRPIELPGHGPKKRPLLRYRKEDLDAQIARWNEDLRGRPRKKAS